MNLVFSIAIIALLGVLSAASAPSPKPVNDRASDTANGTANGGAPGSINLPSFLNVDKNTLENAKRLVAKAIEEQGKLNEARIANPRRNTYDKTRPSSISPSIDLKFKWLNSTESTDTTNQDAASEIYKAAALLAEYHAATASAESAVSPPPGLQIPPQAQDTSFWMENIEHSGQMPFGNDASYKVWRNVREYGARGDGKTDDTDAINRAITDGNRCGANCASSTVKAALVYFPGGIVHRSAV